MKTNDEENLRIISQENGTIKINFFASKSNINLFPWKNQQIKRRKTETKINCNVLKKAVISQNKLYAVGNLKFGFSIKINGKNQRKATKSKSHNYCFLFNS